MESWLPSSGLTWERLPGISVDRLDAVSEYDGLSRLRKFGYDLSAGEVGCFLAHRASWKLASQSNEAVVILESDVAPVSSVSLYSSLADVSRIDTDWDIVRLHGIFSKNEMLARKVRRLDTGGYITQTLGDPMGAAAYIVTPWAAKRLLACSERFHVPVDVFLSQSWVHRLRFRTVSPYLFKVGKFESEIGKRRRPKQSTWARLRIEYSRAADDIKRLAYLPWHFFK